MRFKIQFQLNGSRQRLPLNYQYPLSAWIYKVLAKADVEFTNMLHNEGYQLSNGKTFKLFTFSKLNFAKHTWKIIPKTDRMDVWAKNAWLTVSFQLPEQSERFIMGLFKEQKAIIGDKHSRVEMEVASIEALKDVEIGGCEDVKIGKCVGVKMIAKTAIVLGINVKGEENKQYVLPIHADYSKVFLQNLTDKYIAAGKTPIVVSDMEFKIIKLYPKTSMQTIKAYTPAQTKVKGYYYEFELTAPKDVIEVGLNAGFGSMNALGFGFCEVVKDLKM